MDHFEEISKIGTIRTRIPGCSFGVINVMVFAIFDRTTDFFVCIFKDLFTQKLTALLLQIYITCFPRANLGKTCRIGNGHIYPPTPSEKKMLWICFSRQDLSVWC